MELVLNYISKHDTTMICDSSFIQAILSGISAFPESRRVQLRGCSLVLDLCNDPKARLELMRNGAVSTMIDLHSRFHDDVGFRQLSLLCISGLCRGKFTETQALSLALIPLLYVPNDDPTPCHMIVWD